MRVVFLLVGFLLQHVFIFACKFYCASGKHDFERERERESGKKKTRVGSAKDLSQLAMGGVVFFVSS